MDKIEFENGSELNIVSVDIDATRSKREQEQLQNMKDYYKHNPDKFVEEVLGVKLYSYQRAILKLISVGEKILPIKFRRRIL